MGHNRLTISGTLGGTILSAVPNLSSGDIVETVVLAAIGAVVSYCVTLFLKQFINRVNRNKKS